MGVRCIVFNGKIDEFSAARREKWMHGFVSKRCNGGIFTSFRCPQMCIPHAFDHMSKVSKGPPEV